MIKRLLFTILLLGICSEVHATYLGDFPVNATVHWAFTTNSGAGARTDPSSAWEAADLVCFKDGSDVERASTSGYTITSTFNSETGVTKVSIDLSDNTTAGFWAAGHEYYCVLYPDETVDSQAIASVSANFSIERYTRAPVIIAGTAVVKDAVSVILTIPLVKTSGQPYTGLVFNSTGMVAEYARANASGAATGITLTGTCSLGTFTSGCMLEKDVTAGLYQLHIPDAAFATGTDRGTITISGVAGMVPTIIPYELVNVGLAAIATTLGTPVSSVSADIASVTGSAISELAQGAPSATPTLFQAVMALYMAFRNQTLTTSGQISYSNDAGTVLFKCTLADNGVTFTKSECVTGP